MKSNKCAMGMVVGVLLVLTAGLWGQATVAVNPAVTVDPNAVVAEPNQALAPMEAEAIKVTGKSVQYSLDGGQAWQPLTAGTKLPQQAAVRTGFASTCEVSFRGHTVLIVEPLSSVKIGEYLGNDAVQKVQANLQYGAVRCGVEKGRVKSDTKVSTAVSTLSIRGTVVYVEYDRGNRRCQLKVEEGGPALAMTSQGEYLLEDQMDTDCALTPYLEQAIFTHYAWMTGELNLGYDNEGSNESSAHYGNTPVWNDGNGASTNNNPQTQGSTQAGTGIIDFSGGDIPIGGNSAPAPR